VPPTARDADGRNLRILLSCLFVAFRLTWSESATPGIVHLTADLNTRSASAAVRELKQQGAQALITAKASDAVRARLVIS
jgi:hypothetical protein